MKRSSADDGDSRPFWEDAEFLHSHDALPPRPRPFAAPVHGAARWADKDDLQELLVADPSDPHVTILDGFAPIVTDPNPLGVAALYGRRMHLGEERLGRHLLAIGQTGTGKTTGLVLPMIAAQLRDRRRSLVVFDVKGELSAPIDEIARRAGRDPTDVLRIDLTDPTRSLGWNPAPEDLAPDAAFDLALHMCRSADARQPGGSSESPFWTQTSTDLIAGILCALTADAREQPSLARVREILNLPRTEFLRWFERQGEHPQLERFRAFLQTESHNAHTALTDASNRLLTFMDRALCAVTSQDELRFRQLVERPTVLLVVVPEAHVERLRPLFNLLIQQLFAELIRIADQPRHGGRLPRPITLFLDEFASVLGRIPDFEIRLNTLRSRRVTVIAAAQNLGQVRLAYGPSTGPVLAGFSTKVFLPGLELEDAEYASRLSGTATVESVVIHEAWSDEASAWRPHVRDRVPLARPLLLPEEIANPRAHFELGRPMTWLFPDLPPFQAWLLPAHRSADLGPILRAAREGRFADRGMRAEPLTWEQVGADPLTRPAQVDRRLRSLETRCGLRHASRRTRGRWRAVVARHLDEPQVLLDCLRRLQRLGLDLDGFFAASDRAETEHPPAVLAWLEFEQLREAGRSRSRITGLLPFDGAEVEPSEGPLDDIPF